MGKVSRFQKTSLQLSDLEAAERPSYQMTGTTKIDRIDCRGDIREHRTHDGKRTICGLAIDMRQPPCGNRSCKRCEKIIARLSETTGHGVMEMPTPYAMKPKQAACDWCQKPRSDLRSMDGETRACFLCRREASRRRIFDEKQNRYVQLENS